MPKGGRETTQHGTFHDHPRLEQAIVLLGTAQHAVLGLEQLTDVGLSASGLRSRVARHRLHRIHHRVYALVPSGLLSREGHWMAAVLACGQGAVLSHRTAAALHQLRPTYRVKIDVTVPRRSSRAHPKIELHRTTTLTDADVTLVNGIPCTTIARTLFDITEAVSRRALERAFDQWEMMDRFDLRAIQAQLARNPTRPAARRVRQLLNEYYIGCAPTQSELEEAFFAVCRSVSAPLPKVNEWVDLGDGEPMIWADFVWRQKRVIVETDGDKFHGTHQARQRDPRRDQRAIVAGWRPIRTTWRQVMFRPHELRPTIVKLVNG
jgi:predicted transcriptional regulator of viral defense system